MDRCINCGAQLSEGHKFCPECGTAVITKEKEVKNKCPNCGEILNSFMTNCPACGYELRKASTSSALENLSNELKMVDAKERNIYQPTNLVEKVFGKTEEKIRQEQSKIEREKIRERANIIINFNVPNTKEDLVEFALAASANIEKTYKFEDLYVQNEECKAWLFKLDQVYKKAVISMENEPEFAIIKDVHDSINEKIKFNKIKPFIFMGAIFLCMVFAGLASLGIIGIIAIMLIIPIIGLVLYMNKDKIFKKRQ